jgi:hypothetical protein
MKVLALVHQADRVTVFECVLAGIQLQFSKFD